MQEAEKHGLVLAIENHGGLPCTGEEQVEVIRALHSPSLKATIDVGNYLQGNQEAHVGTRLAAPYAAYVHFKDFKKIPDAASPFGWKLESCGLGEGVVDHRACLDALAAGRLRWICRAGVRGRGGRKDRCAEERGVYEEGDEGILKQMQALYQVIVAPMAGIDGISQKPDGRRRRKISLFPRIFCLTRRWRLVKCNR